MNIFRFSQRLPETAYPEGPLLKKNKPPFLKIAAMAFPVFSNKSAINLNKKHLKTLPLTINIEKIDVSLELDNLLDLFDGINFHSSTEPGYMPPSCLQNQDIQYTPQQLRKYLEKFILHVKNQEPTFGAPAFDSPNLPHFFTYIEQAVKFCIHRVNSKYDAFLEKRFGVPPSSEDPDYPTYQNLLENKARLALDLAFAGTQCAGSYMSTAIELYQFFRDKEAKHLSSLEGIVLSSLADAREQIANTQIYNLVCSLKDQTKKDHSSHVRNQYMTKFGAILGIPGMETCTEESSLVSLNKKKCLSEFFAIYTPDFVIHTLQEKVKTSRNLQEALVDWTKERAGSWQEVEYKQQADILYQKITDSESDHSTSSFKEHISLWFSLLEHLRSHNANLAFSAENDWSSFVIDILYSEEAKLFYKASNFSTCTNDLYKTIALSQIKELCRTNTYAFLERKTISWQELDTQITKLNQVAKINHIILKTGLPRLSEDCLLRSLENKTYLHQLIVDHLDRARKEAFLARFCPFTREKKQQGLEEEFNPITGAKIEVLHELLKQCNILK